MAQKNYAISELVDNAYTSRKGLRGNNAVSKVYLYTNERIRQYIDCLNIADGRVATVGSSGDQALYSIFKGAEEVTIIDANPYTKPMVELKMSAIKNMSYSQFVDYWTNKNIFNKHIYRELMGDVSKETKDFFDVLESIYPVTSSNGIAKDIVHSSARVIFRSMLGAVSDNSGCEFYDNTETYNELRNNIDTTKIDFCLAEFKDFPRVLNKKYNTIIASNIFDYYQGKVRTFFDTSKALIDIMLADKGTMQMHYNFLNNSTFETFENVYMQGYNKTRRVICNDSQENNKEANASSKNILDSIFRRTNTAYVYEK